MSPSPHALSAMLSVRIVLAMYLVLALADAQNVHNFEVEEEFTGSFVVLGTTGSGKTTLIKHLTPVKMGNMSKGAQHRTSIISPTTESKVYKTRIKIDGVSVSLKLRDTVGFGAKDMATKNILKETFLSVATNFEKIRGCILVHRCERDSEGGYEDLKQIKQMFESTGLQFDKHLLIVITHSGHLNDEAKQSYSDDIRTKVIPEFPFERIMHVNFANLEELSDHHRQFYTDTTKEEFHKLMTKLQEFEDEIAPVEKNIREFMDNSYDNDLNKKKGGITDLLKTFWNWMSSKRNSILVVAKPAQKSERKKTKLYWGLPRFISEREKAKEYEEAEKKAAKKAAAEKADAEKADAEIDRRQWCQGLFEDESAALRRELDEKTLELAQLKQSLQEAGEEITTLKENIKINVP